MWSKWACPKMVKIVPSKIGQKYGVVKLVLPHANKVRANSFYPFNRAIIVAQLSLVKMVPFKIGRASYSFNIWPPLVRSEVHLMAPRFLSLARWSGWSKIWSSLETIYLLCLLYFSNVHPINLVNCSDWWNMAPVYFSKGAPLDFFI